MWTSFCSRGAIIVQWTLLTLVIVQARNIMETERVKGERNAAVTLSFGAAAVASDAHRQRRCRAERCISPHTDEHAEVNLRFSSAIGLDAMCHREPFELTVWEPIYQKRFCK